MKELIPLKKTVKELEAVGEEGHDGPLIDLAVMLNRIIRQFEHKGIHYVLTKYAPELIAKPN